VIKRLRGLEKTDLTGHVIETKVPSNLSKTLLEIFQTSSDETFNKIFEHLFLNGFQASITKGAGISLSKLRVTTQLYTLRIMVGPARSRNPTRVSSRRMLQGPTDHVSIVAVWAMTLHPALNLKTRTGSNKIERSNSTLVTWHVKPKADAVAEAVVDEAAVEAVAEEVVEDDPTSPHPNPRKTTNEVSLGSCTPITLPPSVGTRLLQASLLWQPPTPQQPQSFQSPTLRTSFKLHRMTMNDRKP
jgi:hypothetical protein